MEMKMNTDRPVIVPGERRVLDSWAELVDIHPLQWRRWYDLFHRPNQAENGVYILHDNGRILTVNPARARKALHLPEKIDHPQELAETLYAAWEEGPVAIIDRQHMNASQDFIARNYVPGDDFFTFLIQIKDRFLADAGSGLAIYPQPWTEWQFITPEFPAKLARLISPQGSRVSVVLAIYLGVQLYTGGLIGLENGLIKLVTTLPDDNLAAGEASSRHSDVKDNRWKSEAPRWLEFAKTRFATVTLGLACQKDLFDKLGWGPSNWPKWLDALHNNEALALPDPQTVAGFAELLKDLF